MTSSQFFESGPDADRAAARRGGLIGWGVLLIVLGAILCVAIVITLLAYVGAVEQNLVGASAPRRSRSSNPPRMELEVLLGFVILTVTGAGLLWTGIGSCLARRWVRPVVVIGSLLFLLLCLLASVAGLMVIPALLERVDESFARRSQGPTSGDVLAVAGIRFTILFGIGVFLPWLIFRFYSSPKTRQALDVLDPRRLWTDRCPLPVLGWAAFAGLSGVLLLLALFSPALPAFVVLLTGAPAVIVITILAIFLLWCALLCYRLDRLGWIVSFALLVLLRVSTVVFFWTGGSLADSGKSVVVPAINLSRRQVAEWVPDWIPITVGCLEILVVMGFGLYAARFFTSAYRVGLVRDKGDETRDCVN